MKKRGVFPLHKVCIDSSWTLSEQVRDQTSGLSQFGFIRFQVFETFEDGVSHLVDGAELISSLLLVIKRSKLKGGAGVCPVSLVSAALAGTLLDNGNRIRLLSLERIESALLILPSSGNRYRHKKDTVTGGGGGGGQTRLEEVRTCLGNMMPTHK